MKPGAEDDRVHLPLPAVGRHHRVAADLPNPIGDHLHVGLHQHRVPLVGGQNALAADLVARGQPLAQLAVGHLLLELAKRQLSGEPAHAPVTKLNHERLARPVDRRPHRALGDREPPVEGALERLHRPVGMWNHPGRRSLVDVQPLDLGLDARHELDRRGTGADHRDPLSAQVVVVVPCGGVKERALEGLEPGDLGELRLAHRALAAHEHVGRDRALRAVEAPAGALLIPCRALEPAIEAHVLAYAEPRRHAPEVLEDLRLGGVGARPARVGRKGERVEVRGNVAAAARIGVVTPGASQVARTLEQNEVALAVTHQTHGHSDAREAGADDDHAVVAHVRRSLPAPLRSRRAPPRTRPSAAPWPTPRRIPRATCPPPRTRDAAWPGRCAPPGCETR